MGKLAFISEAVAVLALCVVYYYFFGRVKTSKRAKVVEVISLFSTLIIFGVTKNLKIWLIFIAFFIIGTIKKTTAKNERGNRGHNY